MRISSCFPQQVEQLPVDRFISGANLGLREHIRAAGKVGDKAARFPHQNDAGRYVPGPDAALPVSVATTGGDHREVNGGRARRRMFPIFAIAAASSVWKRG